MKMTENIQRSYFDLITETYKLFEADLHGMDPEYIGSGYQSVEDAIYKFIDACSMNRQETLEAYNELIEKLKDNEENEEQLNQRLYGFRLFPIMRKIFNMYPWIMAKEASEADMEAIRYTMGYIVTAYERYLAKELS